MVTTKLITYIKELKGRNRKASETINAFAHETDDTVQAERLRMIHKYNYTNKIIKELEELLTKGPKPSV